MSESVPNRRERKKAARRERILEAAVALFEARGVEDTRVGEICERADVAEKTFFNHFPSKAHLLREIADAGLSQLLERVEDVRKRPGTTRERLAILFQSLAAEVQAAGRMHRELINEFIQLGQRQGAEETRRMHAAFGALIREGRDAGELTPDHDDETLTELVLGAFYTLAFDHAHLEQHPIAERAEALARLLGDSISKPPEDGTSGRTEEPR